MLAVFITFFFFPFSYGIFIDGSENPQTKITLFAIGGVTQFIYFFLELVEVYQIGKNYKALKVYFIGWNVNDFMIPFCYMAHVFSYYYSHQYDLERKHKSITHNMITIFTLF
jgi:hypothetical protein